MKESNFNMQTFSLTGPQKAALLLGEMDSSFCEYLKKKLSKKEYSKLAKEFFKLGSEYNPENLFEVNREIFVLEEVKKYGLKHGIYKEVSHFEKTVQKNNNNFADIVKDNTDAIASILSKWMRED